MKSILALLADFANGIFAVLIACAVYDISPQWWYFLIGLPLAMLPDIDAIPELLKRGRVSSDASYTRDHRTFLHYPIISVVIFTPVFLYGGFWGLVVVLAVLLHLLNDLYGTGWGLQLLWPLSTRHYKFFGRRANRLRSMLADGGYLQELPIEETKLRFMVSWSKAELADYITRFGVDNWIIHWYLRPNWVSVVEYSLFLIATTLMIVSLV
ncbi:metal-dependent hydrolase [Patescibacteria group bacterium]|nr:metal-dependent hydrolase [Patescibacteria group bacterium]